jgi:hypothetical protein
MTAADALSKLVSDSDKGNEAACKLAEAAAAAGRQSNKATHRVKKRSSSSSAPVETTVQVVVMVHCEKLGLKTA